MEELNEKEKKRLSDLIEAPLCEVLAFGCVSQEEKAMVCGGYLDKVLKLAVRSISTSKEVAKHFEESIKKEFNYLVK